MDKFKELMENKLFKICLLSIVALIVIIVIVALIAGSKGSRITEASLQNAAKSYLEKNPNMYPKDKYATTTIPISTLVSAGYISGKSDGASCPSYVTVINMGKTYGYSATLKCSNEATNTLLSKLLLNQVTSGNGLYNSNGKYVFKGENPNNYVKFAESKWRIIGIDEANNIKMIYSDITTSDYYIKWDDRYNEEIKESKGINNFEVSRLKEFLDNYIDNNQTLFTAPRMMKLSKHSVCTGKINEVDTNVCSSKVDNVYVSTITAQDYVNASLDSNCSISNSISCQNYNFLNKKSWTITAYKDNTYGAYYIDDTEGLQYGQAYLTRATLPVISLRSDTIYVSGTGTEADPFMIK